MVLTKALVERGFSFPPSDFFLEILKVYGLQPHNISPNSVLAISNHVTLCEGHLRVIPELSLFQYYFTVKKERIRQSSELATCGTITFMIRPGRVYPHTDRHESARYWSGGFFYLKDVSDPANADLWATEEGLTGKDLTLSWFTKRIQPLQHRDRLMFQYTGRGDPMRATKDNLSADALDKRIRVLIKIPRELHVHVCNKDIHMNGSGTALEALEENELGTLLRVPSTGNTDPEAASEAEAPEASRPAKRKKPAPSSPHAKRAREVPSTAATRRAEAEKKRLSLINTSNKGQPAIQHFFKPSGQPPKAPRAPKKKAKPSPASIPVTPEVEVPPKASSASKPDPKDVINLDDLPEDPAHHGDSAKGTSSPVPPPDQPSSAFAGPTEEEQEQKVKLLQVTNATRVDPRPSLQKLTLAQRHAEVSAMLNKVWGKPDEEMRELADLEDGLKVFFAKHKEVRQTTRKLHEDLRVHVLEQITEIEGLRQNAENSQQAIRLLESRLQASLGFEWSKESNLKRTEAYEEAHKSIGGLFEACRGIAKTLSLKKAKTSVIDTMTQLMEQVPDFIKDWQKSSARGVASLVLATCKAHFPALNFADVARGAPKGSDMGAILAETQGYEQLFVRRVNHSFWYNKHALPKGFSDAEEEEGEPEYYAEGSGSSIEHSGGSSGDGSEAAPATATAMAPPTRNLKRRAPSRVPV
ncbi:hypothetical protein QYE76_053795 [Lolium multiflorum]|uniref:Transposase (putative) gypsy type domain-containing protein n=1 Tax=Lolium multiflorum TaxID=4521 RepID=A0AAD8WKS7_LOLMU|nr:hypothetical protein QYE76_053795 [Lolium multiflorum]